MEIKNHRFFGEDICSGYKSKKVLKNLKIHIPEHKISALIGPNGSGKSTLLKTLSNLIPTTSGKIFLDGKDIYKFSSKKLARILGILPQEFNAPQGLKVIDLVSRGRFPHHSIFSNLNRNDEKITIQSLKTMGILSLAKKNVDEISGGQKQRAWIAMVLSQQTDILFLDEPTIHLDLNYQMEILDSLVVLNQKKGTTIVMILHNINLVSLYADYIFALKKGCLIKQGTPNKTITKGLIKKIFNLDSSVISNPVYHCPYVIPFSRTKEKYKKLS